MAANVRVTTELKNPSEIGVHYRLLCMTGPNKGNVYYLTGKRIIIGRGESADIQIVDTKISREHAELSFSENAYTITDLGAQNGIIVNDTKIKQKKLNDGEKIVIGQAVFKYNIIYVAQSMEMLIAEATPDSAMAKEIKRGVKVKLPPKNIKNEVEDNFKMEKPVNANATSKSKFLIFGVILIAVVFILMGGDDKPATAVKALKKVNPTDLEIFNESVIVKAKADDP